MANLFQKLIDWIVWAFKSLVLSIWELLKDAFFWALETILNLVAFLIDGIFSAITVFNPASYISALPGDVISVMGAVGVGEAFSIIVVAILTRMALQLVPFTRLGS